MNERSKQILTLVITFAGILAPSLFAEALFGQSTGDISGSFFGDVYVIPAGYVFAIWAPIYLGFLAFAVFQVLPAQRGNPRFERVRLWLMATALLNTAWIAAFGGLNFPLSLLIIVVMLAIALVMHRVLEIGRTPVQGWERALRLPFGLYAGWLTVATIANTSAVLVAAGWDGFGLSNPVWGVIMLVVATALGLVTRFRLSDPVYGAVFVWAFIGIVVAQSDTPVVAVTAAVGALLFALSLLVPLRGVVQPGSTRQPTRV